MKRIGSKSKTLKRIDTKKQSLRDDTCFGFRAVPWRGPREPAPRAQILKGAKKFIRMI